MRSSGSVMLSFMLSDPLSTAAVMVRNRVCWLRLCERLMDGSEGACCPLWTKLPLALVLLLLLRRLLLEPLLTACSLCAMLDMSKK